MSKWKDIKGYEGMYQVSDEGKIRSLDRKVKDATQNRYQNLKGKILKESDNGKGYKLVFLSKNRKRKNKYVHRLVAEAFIPNPDNLKEVNHKDLDKSNNCVRNLEWISNIDNKRHYQKTEIAKEKNRIRSINKKIKYREKIESKIPEIIFNYKEKKMTIRELSKTMKMGSVTISKILNQNNVPKNKRKLNIPRDEKGRFVKKETII